jgi:hypothetical protein
VKKLRPFHHEFAWAYDAIIGNLIVKQCAFISEQLVRAKTLPANDCSTQDAAAADTRSS